MTAVDALGSLLLSDEIICHDKTKYLYGMSVVGLSLEQLQRLRAIVSIITINNTYRLTPVQTLAVKQLGANDPNSLDLAVNEEMMNVVGILTAQIAGLGKIEGERLLIYLTAIIIKRIEEEANGHE